MTFAELRSEYESKTVDAKIYALVGDLCAMVARRYPEAVYNHGLTWNDASIDELRQEVVGDLLIDQGQIHYIFSIADTLESVRKLLTHQVKRALANRRHIGPIDRLLRRVRRLADDSSEYHSTNTGGQAVYQVPGTQLSYEPLRVDQIAIAVAASSEVPRLVSRRDASRESMIYTTGDLKEVLRLVIDAVGPVSVTDLRRIFEHLLTPWNPTTLVPVEDHYAQSKDTSDESIQEQQMIAAARNLATGLTLDESWVLVLKSQNASDASVAARIAKSRPTVANMKVAVFERVRIELLTGLPTGTETRAMEYLLDFVTELVDGGLE